MVQQISTVCDHIQQFSAILVPNSSDCIYHEPVEFRSRRFLAVSIRGKTVLSLPMFLAWDSGIWITKRLDGRWSIIRDYRAARVLEKVHCCLFIFLDGGESRWRAFSTIDSIGRGFIFNRHRYFYLKYRYSFFHFTPINFLNSSTTVSEASLVFFALNYTPTPFFLIPFLLTGS